MTWRDGNPKPFVRQSILAWQDYFKAPPHHVAVPIATLASRWISRLSEIPEPAVYLAAISRRQRD
jgi:hypothetical protein